MPTLAHQVEAAFGRSALDRMLRDAIPDLQHEPSPLHVALLDLPWSDIFTTSYDTLLERARRSVISQRYDVVLKPDDLDHSNRPRIVTLHGNLFYGTGIPASILVLSRNKPRPRKDKVLFIDASGEFDEGSNQNSLRDEDIRHISTTFHRYAGVEKYARVVPLTEIEQNDWNLNIGRYVDTSEEEQHIDLAAAVRKLRELERSRAVAEATMNRYLTEFARTAHAGLAGVAHTLQADGDGQNSGGLERYEHWRNCRLRLRYLGQSAERRGRNTCTENGQPARRPSNAARPEVPAPEEDAAGAAAIKR